MPKLLGLNALGVLGAGVIFFLLGFLLYGLVFMQKMIALTDYNINSVTGGIACMVIGSIGLGIFLKWLNTDRLVGVVKYGLVVAICSGTTTQTYDWIYSQFPIHMATMDGAYTLIGYSIVSAIWPFFG